MIGSRLQAVLSGILALAVLGGGPAAASSITKAGQFNALRRAAATRNPVVLVANLSGGVQIFSANIHEVNPPLLETITTGAPRPTGLWVDRHQTLFVVNNNSVSGSFVSEYKHGTTAPFRMITQGLYTPGHVAVGSDGTVYVTDYQNNYDVVIEYARGSLTPERVVDVAVHSRGLGIGGLAFDAKGDLLVGAFSQETEQGQVYSIAPGSSTATSLNLQSVGGSAIAIDGLGNLYVGDIGGAIQVYPPGSTSPSRTMSSGTYIFGMTAARNGTVYAVSYYSGMFEYAPGASGPTNSFLTGGAPMDAALAKSW